MTAVAVKVLPQGSPQIMPHRGHVATHERREWRYYPELGHTKEQVLAPDYWAHVSRTHRVGDKLEVFAEDGSFYGELLVVACDKNYTKVHVLAWHDLNEKALKADSQFKIEWKGPVKKFCVVRLSDAQPVHEGLQTRDEAQAWLDQNRPSLT